jgi:cytochrome P450
MNDRIANEDSLLAWSAAPNPYPHYHRLQQEDPLHWSEPLRAWVLTRYDDVASAFRDPRLTAERLPLIIAGQLRDIAPADMRDYLGVFEHTLLMKDPPEHTRLRKAASSAFAPSVVAGWSTTIRDVTDELVARLADRPGGSVDLVTQFADIMPGTIIGRIFGIPLDRQADFSRWANAMAMFFGGFSGQDHHAAGRAANEGARELTTLFLGEAAKRRAKGLGDDLLSHLLRGQDEGRLSEVELGALCVFILAAGLATLTDQISNGLLAFLRHPKETASLIAEGSVGSDGVIAEVLRYDGAVPFAHRIAREDIALHGGTIRAGQVVFLSIGAANHDASQFANPDAFDLHRAPGRAITLGGGAHYCLGASLAHLEMSIAFSRIFERHPKLRLDPTKEPVHKASLLFRGLTSLPAVLA